MALIIDGMLNGKLPWELVLLGALIAVVLELAALGGRDVLKPLPVSSLHTV